MAAAEKHYTPPVPEFNKPVKLLIVVAPYYKDIADDLVKGAKAAIKDAGGTYDLIEVPGALEIPTAIAISDRTSNFDGFVALGCVIRGETTHYDTVCNDSSRMISQMGLNGICIGNGILTVETRKQAKVRADVKDQNKGAGAAIAALHLVALSRKWGRETKGFGFKPASEEFKMADSTDDGPKTA